MKSARYSLRLTLAIALLLSACGPKPPTNFFPEPLKPPRSAESSPKPLEEVVGQPKKTLTIDDTPSPPPAPALPKTKDWSQSAHGREEANITLNFDQERLPTLIQLVYGTILKKNYTLDPAVASRPDTVTLRTGPQTPSQVEQTIRLLLKSYGIAVLDLGGNAFRIVPDADLKGYSPEILRGRARPNVPLPLRPIFQVVELHTVRYSDVLTWLRAMFGTKVTVFEDPSRNAVMLSGQADDIAAALEAIQVLDQPVMKGRKSARINPVYLQADEMSRKLTDMLTAEGYYAANSVAQNAAVTLIPIQALNTVIAFAADQGILSHTLEWAIELDKPSRNRSGPGYFTYQVQNTDAQKLADTIRDTLSSAMGSTTPLPSSPSSGIGTPTTTPPVSSSASVGKKIVINAATNTLIFNGSGEEYTQILGLLQELDRPAKAALIEVTVAEVDLADSLSLGVELSSEMLKQGAFTALTNGAAGAAGLTLRYFPPPPASGASSASAAIDAISALAAKNRAKILSSPRLMARNGETASIQVGQQVPFVTSSQTNQATGGVGVIQAIQYKDVGVILKVKPVIYSGDRIELEVSQEVSDAVATTTGVTSSPTINTKKVETRLALKDGSTVMLGGLISDSASDGVSGVPLLMDIPWLGQLFRTNTISDKRQELIILITPYTVLGDQDAQAITETFRKQLPWASKETGRPATPMPDGTAR